MPCTRQKEYYTENEALNFNEWELRMKKVILLSASMLLLSASAFAVKSGGGSLNASTPAEQACHVNHIKGCIRVSCDGHTTVNCLTKSGASIPFTPSTTSGCITDANENFTVILSLDDTSLSCGHASAPASEPDSAAPAAQ